MILRAADLRTLADTLDKLDELPEAVEFTAGMPTVTLGGDYPGLQLGQDADKLYYLRVQS